LDNIISASSNFLFQKSKTKEGMNYKLEFELSLNGKKYSQEMDDPTTLKKDGEEFFERYTKSLIYSFSIGFGDSLEFVSDSAFLSESDQTIISDEIVSGGFINVDKINEKKKQKSIGIGEIILCEYVDGKYLWSYTKEFVDETFKSKSEELTIKIGKMFQKML
jgi:hypothetical protein